MRLKDAHRKVWLCDSVKLWKGERVNSADSQKKTISIGWRKQETGICLRIRKRGKLQAQMPKWLYLKETRCHEINTIQKKQGNHSMDESPRQDENFESSPLVAFLFSRYGRLKLIFRCDQILYILRILVKSRFCSSALYSTWYSRGLTAVIFKYRNIWGFSKTEWYFCSY